MAARRKHSKIDKLPDDLREAVEQMMQGDFTYAEIADYVKSHGFDISVASVYRHAKTLNATVQELRIVQENFRVISEELAKYPSQDTTEGILRLLSHQLIGQIQKMPEEAWTSLDTETILKQSAALIRVASYKSHTDLKNRGILDAGFEQVKTMVFEALAKERPELYKEVSGFLNAKSKEIREGDE